MRFRLDFFRLESSGPSYRQSSQFCTFCALPRGGWREGVLLYCMAVVDNRLAALSFARSARATRARARRTFVPAG